MARVVLLVLLTLASVLLAGTTAVRAQPARDEVCVTSAVEGASGRVCARRDGFGVAWTAQLEDTVADGRPVSAEITLSVDAGRDPSARVETDADQLIVRDRGRLAPRTGTSIRSVAIETCVNVRFAPDRCQSESVSLNQPEPRATAVQLERLDELIFESPLDAFIEVWSAEEREGVDASFDWTSDGCSAGPFRELFDEDLQLACIRHDFAYRNYGQKGLAATDEVRARVDAQLASDIAALDQGGLASRFEGTLRQFGGPVFYGEDLGTLWGVPEFILRRIRTPELPSE